MTLPVVIWLLLCAGILLYNNAEIHAEKTVCDICNCIEETNMVDCSNRNLSYIPRDINVTTKILNMSSNFLEDFGNITNPFENLTALKVLDLYNTSLTIRNITGDMFSGLGNLEVLNISHNDQLPLTNETTPTYLFAPLTSLKILRMYGTTGTYNIIPGYPDVHLNDMKNLTELWIDGLTNKQFGLAFQNMTNLKMLRLPGDYVRPSWRSKEFCSTNIVDNMLDNLITISHLYIRKCDLKNISQTAFLKLVHLEFLDLSENRQLSVLGASKAFGSLPGNFAELVLNGLHTSSSKAGSILITKDMMKCLQYTSLKKLHMNDNRIQSINQDVFQTLPSTLETINANSNMFYVGYYIFYVQYLCNLKEMDLSRQFFEGDINIWHNTGQKSNMEHLFETEFQNNIPDNQNETHNDGTGCLNKKVLQNNAKQCEAFISKLRDRTKIKDDSFTKLKETVSAESGQTPAHRVNLSTENQISISVSKNEGADYQLTNDTGNRKINNETKYANQAEQQADIQYHTSYLTSSFDNSSDILQRFCPQPIQVQFIPPGTITAYIPRKLKYLDLSHSKHGVPIFHFEISEDNSIEILNVSSSLLYCWEGPIRGLNKLRYLDLSNNLCGNVSFFFFQHVPSLETLNIGKNFLGAVVKNDNEGKLFQNLTSLKYLDMNSNLITYIPDDFFSSLTNLQTLNLDFNNIDQFTVNIKHLTKLRDIELYYNKITTLSEESRTSLMNIAAYRNKTDPLTVNLRNNPIQCFCNNRDFLQWASEHVDNSSNLHIRINTCVDENHAVIKISKKGNSTFQEVLNKIDKRCKTYFEIIIGVSIAIAVIVNVIIGVIVHRFRWRIQYWWYVLLGNNIWQDAGFGTQYEPIRDNYVFDVFVASPEDLNEFLIDKVIPEFKRANVIAYFPVKHISANEKTVSKIGRAINKSRVVLFIVSSDWSSDYLMTTSLYMWQCDMEHRKKQSVFVVYMSTLAGIDMIRVKDIFSEIFMDYPGDVDADVENAFWRDCVQNIRHLGS